MSDPERDVLADLAAAPPPVAPPLPAALEDELARLAPVATRRPLRQLAVLVAVSLIYGAGLLSALGMREDLGELPVPWLVAAGLGWLVGFLVPSYLALVPRSGAVLPRWRPAALAVVVAAVGFVTLGLAIHPAGPSSAVHGWDRFAEGHACLELGVATAIVPVVIGALVLRRALPVGARWIAAALGAGGGGLGGLVLHLHCNVVDGLHVGLIHGGVVIASALLSAALVPRATTLR